MNRRYFIGTTAALALVSALPAWALTAEQASDLVGKMTGEITKIINSGKSETAMYGDFDKAFNKYADVATIARTTLGPPARSASASQMNAYTTAFRGYISRKYGKRFREFIGGKIVVKSAREFKTGRFEVKTDALLAGEAPFEVVFLVSAASGKNLFYDMLIEGISLLKAEKQEIGSLLDKNRGDLDKMIAALSKAG
ncbi:MAG: ABC transporter substrate-binding protein [Deltaproteobacteria bacterium]